MWIALLGVCFWGASCGGLGHVPAPAASPGALHLVAGGDVMFGRWLAGGAYRPHDAAAQLAAATHHFDPEALVMVNLETALCDATPPDLDRARDRVFLTAPGKHAEDLVRAGVDLASVANNHALDCGHQGFVDTLESIDRVGIEPIGSLDADSRSDVADVATTRVVDPHSGVTVHLVAVSERPIPGWQRERTPRPAMLIDHARLEEALVNEVTALRETWPGDVIVVSLHWGPELVDRPLPAQQSVVGVLRTAGATVVLGHHAHVAQPFEVTRDGVVAYSLGNLAFDMRQPAAAHRGVLDMEFCTADQYNTPRLRKVTWHALSASDALEALGAASAALGESPRRDGESLVWDLGACR